MASFSPLGGERDCPAWHVAVKPSRGCCRGSGLEDHGVLCKRGMCIPPPRPCHGAGSRLPQHVTRRLQASECVSERRCCAGMTQARPSRVPAWSRGSCQERSRGARTGGSYFKSQRLFQVPRTNPVQASLRPPSRCPLCHPQEEAGISLRACRPLGSIPRRSPVLLRPASLCLLGSWEEWLPAGAPQERRGLGMVLGGWGPLASQAGLTAPLSFLASPASSAPPRLASLSTGAALPGPGWDQDAPGHSVAEGPF